LDRPLLGRIVSRPTSTGLGVLEIGEAVPDQSTCGWASPLEEALSEAGNPALTPKALAMLRVIRAYERRVRQLALKADYRLARILPR